MGFTDIGSTDYDGYLLVKKDNVENHFFKFNYRQVYIRTNNIEALYQSMLGNNSTIHPAGYLQIKPWGQKEFAILDPGNNLLTFGQRI